MGNATPCRLRGRRSQPKMAFSPILLGHTGVTLQTVFKTGMAGRRDEPERWNGCYFRTKRNNK